MRLYHFLTAVSCIILTGCSYVLSNERYVVLPELAPGPYWQDRGFEWDVRWEHGRERIVPNGGVFVDSDYMGAVIAQAVTPDGFQLGYPAGRILRDAVGEAEIELLYEYGWLASVVLFAAEGGLDPSRINTRRLQDEAGGATGGRRFLLDNVAFARALAANTLTAELFRADLVELPPDIEGWSLHYPPRPGMPDGVRAGLHIIWHPVDGIGWLYAAPDQLAWGDFNSGLFDNEVHQFIRYGNNLDD